MGARLAVCSPMWLTTGAFTVANHEHAVDSAPRHHAASGDLAV